MPARSHDTTPRRHSSRRADTPSSNRGHGTPARRPSRREDSPPPSLTQGDNTEDISDGNLSSSVEVSEDPEKVAKDNLENNFSALDNDLGLDDTVAGMATPTEDILDDTINQESDSESDSDKHFKRSKRHHLRNQVLYFSFVNVTSDQLLCCLFDNSNSTLNVQLSKFATTIISNLFPIYNGFYFPDSSEMLKTQQQGEEVRSDLNAMVIMKMNYTSCEINLQIILVLHVVTNFFCMALIINAYFISIMTVMCMMNGGGVLYYNILFYKVTCYVNILQLRSWACRPAPEARVDHSTPTPFPPLSLLLHYWTYFLPLIFGLARQKRYLDSETSLVMDCNDFIAHVSFDNYLSY